MNNIGVVARLSSETQLHHGDVDTALDRLLAAPTATAYRGWLLRHHGLLAPLEAAFETTVRLAEIVELRERRKVPRIRSDLLALGVSWPQIAAAPTCTSIPGTFTRVPVALGWMYAVDRSMFQHGTAYRQLARVLPGEVAFGSSFLMGYEGNIGVLWRSLLATIEATCATPETTSEVLAGAQDAFRCLRRWQQCGSDAGQGAAMATQHLG